MTADTKQWTTEITISEIMEIITYSDIIAAELDMIEGESLEDKLYNLSLCECCDRHQTNKPVVLQGWTDCASNRFLAEEEHELCICQCRHLARMICRDCD